MAKIEWRGDLILNQINTQGMNKLIEIAEGVKDYMKNSMPVEGSGRLYRRPGGRMHRASAPGHPPAQDTGRLHDSISVNWYRSGMKYGKVGSKAKIEDGVERPTTPRTVVVGTSVVNPKTGAPYPDYLETGTSKMKARPYIRPALMVARQLSSDIMSSGIRRNFLVPRSESGQFSPFNQTL